MKKQSSLSLFLAISLTFFSLVLESRAEPRCNAISKEIPAAAIEANADAIANWRESAGSIAAESARLLKEAEQAMSILQKPKDLCPSSCKLADQPKIVFRSVPKAFRTSYDDAAKCNQLLEQTKTKPLKYSNKDFDSIKSFSDWFGKFSQGKGSEGKDLYQRCDGDCSPQYKTILSPAGQKLSLLAEVICGPARDKSSNRYQLSTSYLWECQSV